MISQCSIALLEAALAGSLPPEDEASLERHLEECEACGAAMEQLAGGAASRQEAASLLGGDELDDALPVHDEWSEADFTVEHLEPSDEPNVLGRLGGYDVLEIIGRGGMGVVLKAFDRELKRCVAIKVLAPHLAHNSLAKKRFAREAQAAAAVVHPHVLAIHHVQPNARLPFLVMPLVAGESLAQRLKTQGTLELKEILRIGMQAAAGLGAAHDQGLVHRDVKPANILLEKGVERAVLTDFGLARAADDVSMTRWGIIAGTPQYMSPEQAKGEPLDGRSDLFSLGCVLYEMATGVSPFRTDSAMATMRRLVDDAPQAMVSFNPELPPWFIAIVDQLLEKAPSRRFGSAKEVTELLEGCLAHLQQPASVPLRAALPKLVPQPDSGRGNSRLKGDIAMVAILGIGLLGWIILLPQEPVQTGGIELVALAKYPTMDSPWWKPDGSPLSESPVDSSNVDIRSNQDPKVVWLTALFRVPGGLDTLLGGDSIQRVDGGMSLWGGWQFIRGQPIKDLVALAVAVRSDAKHVDLAMRVAHGAWQTAATVGATNLLAKGEITQDGKVWHVKREGRDLILKVDNTPKDVQLRVALGRKEQFTIAVPLYSQSGKAGDDSRGTARIAAWQFKDVSEEGIHSFILQTRPYKTVEFRNVALQSDSKPAAEGASSKATFGPVIERVLPSDVDCKHQYFQFRKGEIFVVGNGPGTTVEEFAEDRKKAEDAGGIDISVTFSEEGIHLVGEEGIFTQDMENLKWDTTTAEKVVKGMKHARFTYGVVEPTVKDCPITYLFKTSRGQVGIMEILGVVEHKRDGGIGKGMKFRYKLVQQPDQVRKSGGNKASEVVFPQSRVFGPVMERIVNDPQATREKCAINLDSGNLLPLPASFTLKSQTDSPAQQQSMVWARNKHVDAMASVTMEKEKLVKCGLLGSDLLALPVNNKLWDQITTIQLTEQLKRRLSEWGFIPEVAELTTDANFPATYLIQTRASRMGILQITDSAENPRGVKIRYKLIQNGQPSAELSPKLTPASTRLWATKERAREIDNLIKLIGDAPVTANSLPKLFELTPGSTSVFRLRSGVVSLPILPAEMSQVDFVPLGRAIYWPGSESFYIQWGSSEVGPPHYYGPFNGKPADKLGLSLFESGDAGAKSSVPGHAKGVTLTGIAKDSTDRPVAKAVVIVRTAAPRKRVGVLCPSCYADCGKMAVTDGQGKFALTELDPDLVFRLLIVADGYIPAQSPSLADPHDGAVAFTLTQHDLDTRDPARVFRGRVINENGKPVVGAVVSPFGVEKSGRANFGKLKGIDALAVTNDSGEFHLGVSGANIKLFLAVSAPFMAPRHFRPFPVSDKRIDLILLKGVTVTGRIIKDGQPLPGGAIGLVQKERNVKTFVGPFQAASDDNGVFVVRNIPPDDALTLYGVMSALGRQGAIPSRELGTGKSGATINVGDLEVQPAYRLSGRVKLSDGKAVPAGTQVMVSRKEAWDSQQAVAEDNGKFVFEGLPAERYSLAVRVPGYHLSPRNASLDPFDPFVLIGAVGKNVHEICVLLEPGAWPPIDNGIDQDHRVAEHHRRRDAPFQGAPPLLSRAEDKTNANKLSGRVVAVSKDAKSFTFEGVARERPSESVKVEVKIGQKTAITYVGVTAGGAKPTVGYAVNVWMDDTVKGLAARVGFGGSEGGYRYSDLTGIVVDLDKDGKGITMQAPLGGFVDGGAKPKKVSVRFNEKTVFVFSDVREGEARIEKNQSAWVWYDDDARVSGDRIAGQVYFFGSAFTTTSLRQDISGKLLSADERTLTIELPTTPLAGEPKKAVFKVGEKCSFVYANVGPGGAKPAAGQWASVWLKDVSKDTATNVTLSGVAPQRWVTINGKVVGASKDGTTITLEQPSPVRGGKPKRVEIKLTSRTRSAYMNVGPDGAKPTVGYVGQVRLVDGSKDTAAWAWFERRANP